MLFSAGGMTCSYRKKETKIMIDNKFGLLCSIFRKETKDKTDENSSILYSIFIATFVGTSVTY